MSRAGMIGTLRPCWLGVLASLAIALAMPMQANASELPAPGAATIAWHAVELDVEGFSALFPGEPAHLLETTHTILGAVEASRYVYETADDFFSVERHQLPKLSRMLAPASLIIDRAKDGILSDREADEVSFERMSATEHPAGVLRYRTRQGSSAVEIAQIHLVGRNIYLVTAESGESEQERSVVERFMDSFRLLDGD